MANTLQVGQFVFINGVENLPFGDAVTTADLCLIRQGCNGRHRVQGGPSSEVLSEDKRSALICVDFFAFFDFIEEPRSVRGFAIQDRADEAVVLKYEAFVDPLSRIAEDDFIAAFAICENCSAVAELPLDDLQTEFRKKADTLGFAISRTRVELMGLCAACQED